MIDIWPDSSSLTHKLLLVRRQHEAARPGSDDDVVDDGALGSVDNVHHVGDLGKWRRDGFVFAQHHALGFGTGRDPRGRCSWCDVDLLHRRVLFVRDVDRLVVTGQDEHLRAASGRDVIDHLQRCDVDDVDHVVVATGDVEKRVAALNLISRGRREVLMLVICA